MQEGRSYMPDENPNVHARSKNRLRSLSLSQVMINEFVIALKLHTLFIMLVNT